MKQKKYSFLHSRIIRFVENNLSSGSTQVAYKKKKKGIILFLVSLSVLLIISTVSCFFQIPEIVRTITGAICSSLALIGLSMIFYANEDIKKGESQ